MDQKDLSDDLRRIVTETRFGTENVDEYMNDIVDLVCSLDYKTDFDGDEVIANAYIGETKIQWGSSVKMDRHGGYVPVWGFLTIEGYIEVDGEAEYFIFEFEDFEAPTGDIADACDEAPDQLRDRAQERRVQRSAYRNSVL